jgi:hypothetical protein
MARPNVSTVPFVGAVAIPCPRRCACRRSVDAFEESGASSAVKWSAANSALWTSTR